MDTYINQLQNKYQINVILNEIHELILELIHNNESIFFRIKYDSMFPITIPNVEILNKNKYLQKGYLPNDFCMVSLDTHWKKNLVCIFDEVISNI